MVFFGCFISFINVKELHLHYFRYPSYKRKNIVITELKEMDVKGEEVLEEWMKNEVEIEIKVKGIFGINKGQKMLGEIRNWEQKIKIRKNKKQLKKKLDSRADKKWTRNV